MIISPHCQREKSLIEFQNLWLNRTDDDDDDDHHKTLSHNTMYTFSVFWAVIFLLVYRLNYRSI